MLGSDYSTIHYWQGKSHRESYYPESGLINVATFAVSDNGYMDDELGFEYRSTLNPIPGVTR